MASTRKVSVSIEPSNNDVQSTVGNEHFERIKVLGDGSFGSIILVRKRGGPDDDRLYAMKMTSKLNVDEYTLDNVKSERKILEAVLNVPRVVQMHYAFETQSNLHIIVDYLNGGDLLNYQTRKFKPKEVRLLVGEIILAVEQLHKLGIVHRDIKLENLMLQQDGHIVLIDFGSAIQFQRDDESHKIKATTEVGTLDYCAPEVVTQQPHGMAVDWWAVGVITYELLTRKLPFIANTRSEIVRKIRFSEPNYKECVLPKTAIKFIKQLLVKQERNRLGSRGGASELKGHDFFKVIDWNDLSNENYEPPIIPKILHELDTSNFLEDLRNDIDIHTGSSESTCHDGLLPDYYYQ